MTRRQLFAALASLPFVGRFVRKPACDGFADDTAAFQDLAHDGWRWRASPTTWMWHAKPKFEIVDGVLYSCWERS